MVHPGRGPWISFGVLEASHSRALHACQLVGFLGVIVVIGGLGSAYTPGSYERPCFFAIHSIIAI